MFLLWTKKLFQDLADFHTTKLQCHHVFLHSALMQSSSLYYFTEVGDEPTFLAVFYWGIFFWADGQLSAAGVQYKVWSCSTHLLDVLFSVIVNWGTQQNSKMPINRLDSKINKKKKEHVVHQHIENSSLSVQMSNKYHSIFPNQTNHFYFKLSQHLCHPTTVFFLYYT